MVGYSVLLPWDGNGGEAFIKVTGYPICFGRIIKWYAEDFYNRIQIHENPALGFGG